MIFCCTYILGTEHRHHKLQSHWWMLSQASKKFAMEEQGAFDYQYECNREVFFVWWNEACHYWHQFWNSLFATVCGWNTELKQKSQCPRHVTPMWEVLIIMTAWKGSMLLVLRKTWSWALFRWMADNGLDKCLAPLQTCRWNIHTRPSVLQARCSCAVSRYAFAKSMWKDLSSSSSRTRAVPDIKIWWHGPYYSKMKGAKKMMDAKESQDISALM